MCVSCVCVCCVCCVCVCCVCLLCVSAVCVCCVCLLCVSVVCVCCVCLLCVSVQDLDPPPLRRTAQNFALFSLSRHIFLSSFAWGPNVEFGGCLEGRDPEMCTFGFSGCRVKPRRLRSKLHKTDCVPEQKAAVGPEVAQGTAQRSIVVCCECGRQIWVTTRK